MDYDLWLQSEQDYLDYEGIDEHEDDRELAEAARWEDEKEERKNEPTTNR